MGRGVAYCTPAVNNMLRGIFVTGTDTGIGKTVVSAALLHRYRPAGSVGYWKPIQTGIEQDDDSAVVRELGSAVASEIHPEGIRLERPLSPHLAARLAGHEIEAAHLENLIGSLPTNVPWIVEGAGGALVPINDSWLMTDLGETPRPAGAYRGSLGAGHDQPHLAHDRGTARSLAAGRRRGDGRRPQRRQPCGNEQYGDTVVVGEMPWFNRVHADELGRWARAELDPANRLAEFVQS